jgi:hypothetical protein
VLADSLGLSLRFFGVLDLSLPELNVEVEAKVEVFSVHADGVFLHAAEQEALHVGPRRHVLPHLLVQRRKLGLGLAQNGVRLDFEGLNLRDFFLRSLDDELGVGLPTRYEGFVVVVGAATLTFLSSVEEGDLPGSFFSILTVVQRGQRLNTDYCLLL